MTMEIMATTKQEHTTGLMPVSITEKLVMADALVKSGLMPRGLDTKEKVFVALQYGHELGLSPMIAVQNITVINGKPSLSAAIIKGIAMSYGILEKYTEERIEKDGNPFGYRITAKRKDLDTIFEGVFTLDDAKRAGLSGNVNYSKFPDDMVFARAVVKCLRRAIPERLAGLYTPDEIGNIVETTEEPTQKPRDITPPKQEKPAEQPKSTDGTAMMDAITALKRVLDKIGPAITEEDAEKAHKVLSLYQKGDKRLKVSSINYAIAYYQDQYSQLINPPAVDQEKPASDPDF